MLEQYVERILAELFMILPEEWSRIVLFGLILPETYEISFYLKRADTSTYQDAFALQKQKLFTPQERRSVFRNVWNLCCEAQDQMEGEKWKTFTLTVERNGHFSIDYGYNEEIIGKWDEWREKYLV